jgi:glucose-6-phosphate 1-dehydrogenase
MEECSFCASSIVIYGGTGDLTTRKLLPALCKLNSAQLLDENFQVIITGRKNLTSEEYKEQFEKKIPSKIKQDLNFKKGFEDLKSKIFYIQANPDEETSSNDFAKQLTKLSNNYEHPRLFYLALPPKQIVNYIDFTKPLIRENKNLDRIIVEKPFGNNLETSKKLNQKLLSVFANEDILRIDHYLGKEAVQNILFLRFANTFFEPVWNNRFIENIQISFSEKIGIGTRAGYFEGVGILRDVVQNHLLQVLCLVAMEAPLSHQYKDIHLEKRKILKALRPIPVSQVAQETVRAQYEASTIDGKPIKSYIEENNIPNSSRTETYAAFRAYIDTWRWSGVPFYLRAGKRLANNMTEICVNFKPVSHNIFKSLKGSMDSNRLYIRIQPDEGITLQLNSKPPGMNLKVKDVGLKFSYEDTFGSFRPDAYERLLLDALSGNSNLFIDNDEIEHAWKFIDPIVEAWYEHNTQPMEKYPAGSHGPGAACKLLGKLDHQWSPSKGRGCG